MEAAPATWSEYDLKAAFLHKFATYVDWPAPAFATTNAPLVIGILGQDPFGDKLENVLAKQRTYGRPLEIRRLEKIEDVLPARCQMLFIASSEKKRLPAIIKSLQGKPILTVGDTAGFGENGVMINLLVLNRSLGFEINLQTAGEAKLRISSQLVGLAKFVWGRGKEPK